MSNVCLFCTCCRVTSGIGSPGSATKLKSVNSARHELVAVADRATAMEFSLYYIILFLGASAQHKHSPYNYNLSLSLPSSLPTPTPTPTHE